MKQYLKPVLAITISAILILPIVYWKKNSDTSSTEAEQDILGELLNDDSTVHKIDETQYNTLIDAIDVTVIDISKDVQQYTVPLSGKIIHLPFGSESYNQQISPLEKEEYYLVAGKVYSHKARTVQYMNDLGFENVMIYSE